MNLRTPEAIEQGLRKRGHVPKHAMWLAEKLGTRRIASKDSFLVSLAILFTPVVGMLGFTTMNAIGLAPVGVGMLASALVFTAWILVAKFMTRWLTLDAAGLQWIGQTMHDHTYAAWSEIVAGWMLDRPLIMSDYRALKRAQAAHQAWTEAAKAERERQAAQSYLMSAPVGAIVEQKRLERDTAPAQGQPKAPARL